MIGKHGIEASLFLFSTGAGDACTCFLSKFPYGRISPLLKARPLLWTGLSTYSSGKAWIDCWVCKQLRPHLVGEAPYLSPFTALAQFFNELCFLSCRLLSALSRFLQLGLSEGDPELRHQWQLGGYVSCV